jgi:hypothetical protein
MYFYYQQLSMTSWQDTMTKIQKNENFFFLNQFSRMKKLYVIFPQVKLEWGSKVVTYNTIDTW